MRLLGIIFFLFFGLLESFSQTKLESSPTATFTIPDFDLLSFDNRDQLYLSTAQGDLFLFDENGNQINYFSPPQQGRLQQLEAAWTVTVFSFSEDRQEFRILDRFLNPISEGRFPFPEINLAKASTLGNGNIIWIWDESDFNLKRMDYRRKVVMDQQPLNLILNTENLEVLEIREIKNRLFVNTENSGIFIFDNQANLLEKIKIPRFERICYYQERLLWIQGQTIQSYHIPSRQTETLMTFDFEGVKQIQFGQETMALIFQDRIELFDIPDSLQNRP
ncbi:hypothetical protein [Algoriphagus hitonicola]|uniref:Uncharacterized protein n=1 Tax=Algoriphagus hitonicola TaxID=435880 RepID=A0A1I2NYL8_9BACT|nr:hypothetical protein [Algoriphagus hitonicola]SFG08563.1 hypothetical protein SAMN04487988_101356 [Algoriphagus hitonicola]